ncbi:MAG: pirin family protein [Pseudomonadota bacterium]
MSWNPKLDQRCSNGDLIETMIVPHGCDLGDFGVCLHPDIWLATVTCLYEDLIQHRNSFSTKRAIHPGEVNWPIAGKGINHSGRIVAEVQARLKSLPYGIQTWVALPDKDKETEPSFEHQAKTRYDLATDDERHQDNASTPTDADRSGSASSERIGPCPSP